VRQPGDDQSASTVAQPGAEFLVLYDQALPEVYGYLFRRCQDRAVAEDLTSETFLAAVKAGENSPRTVAWLIGIARHKLADHWRWRARQDRLVEQVSDSSTEVGAANDPWDAELEVLRAREVLARLGPHHRAALTLRHLDGLTVPETAAILDRTVHATEALLVRARQAFRHEYEGST
jgi:RNA polymerase sigma-70 factor (ECF subfamily)